MASNKEDNRKIAIYSRKSKYTGKGESIGNQVELCKSKVSAIFGNVDFEKDVVIYEDEGYSGYYTKRPAFQEMMEAVKNKEIKCIFFYKLDRISRNVKDFCEIKDQLEKYDVNFYSASENLENITPSGRAMIMMTSVFAQLERDTIAERIRDNMLELAKTGRWLGGTTPTGYKSEAVESINIDGKKKKLYKLTPINEEIKIVQLIYRKFLELKSQTKLETYMIQNNIKTRNGINFSRWGLKNILTNPVYCIADSDMYNYLLSKGVEIYSEIENFDGSYGVMAYNKTEQQPNKAKKDRDITEWIVSIGKHKGAITGADWVQVQELLVQNEDKRYRKPTKNNSLLSGLIRCSHCGSYMRPKLKSNRTPDGAIRFDYMCELKEKSRQQNCQCKNVNGNEADRLVLDAVKELIAPNSTFRKKLSALAKNKFDGASKDNVELKTLESTLKKNEQAISNLLDRIKFIDVSLIEDITKEIKRLKADNTEIERRIAELKSISTDNVNLQDQAEIVLNIIDTYFSTFDTLDLITKRNLLRVIISNIQCDGENLEINLIGVRENSVRDNVPLCENSKWSTYVFKKH